MTPRQRRFALEYLANGFRGEQAALDAGCSPGHAAASASEFLRLPAVAAFVAERAARAEAKLELTAERVLLEVGRLGFSDIRQLFNENGSVKEPKDWPDSIAACVASVEVVEQFDGSGQDRVQTGVLKKLKLWDKTRNLELLGKHLKLWTDVIEARIEGLDEKAKAERAADLIAKALARRLTTTQEAVPA